jgi:hypothetical protein
MKGRTITEQRAMQIASDFASPGYNYMKAFANGRADNQLEAILDIINEVMYKIKEPETALRPWYWSVKSERQLNSLKRYLEKLAYDLHNVEVHYEMDYYGHLEPFARDCSSQQVVCAYSPMIDSVTFNQVTGSVSKS